MALVAYDVDGRKLRNGFNFNDQVAQTPHWPPRDQETATDPPAKAAASGAANTRPSHRSCCDLGPEPRNWLQL